MHPGDQWINEITYSRGVSKCPVNLLGNWLIVFPFTVLYKTVLMSHLLGVQRVCLNNCHCLVEWYSSSLVLFSVAVFTALHVMQTRYCDEISVRPSVCLSVRRVICDKMEERSVQIFIPYERTFSLVFWEEEWLVVGDPFYLKFWVNRPPFERNSRFSTNNRS